MPRTGTSWVGKILQASGELVYVNEPLNPQHPPGHSPGVLNAHVAHRYQYICQENEGYWLQPFRDTVALRYHPIRELRANRSPYDVGRMLKYGSAFSAGRLTRRRALLDDPFALMSVPWLVDRLGCVAIVMIRNPVALVGSWRALGWQAEMEDLLEQPPLMRDYLGPYEADLREMRESDDVIGRICTLWRALYGAVAQMASLEGVHVYRYQDLVRKPFDSFHEIYDVCGLSWSDRAQEAVAAASTGGGSSKSHSFRGLSKTAYRPMNAATALGSYRSRLSDAEIARVRELTADVASIFYPPGSAPGDAA
jgi:hypothetical protein